MRKVFQIVSYFFPSSWKKENCGERWLCQSLRPKTFHRFLVFCFKNCSDLHWEFFWGDHILEQFTLIVTIKLLIWSKQLGCKNLQEQVGKCFFFHSLIWKFWNYRSSPCFASSMTIITGRSEQIPTNLIMCWWSNCFMITEKMIKKNVNVCN